jgi:uncharacterized protein (TIGR02145 family)
MKKTVLILIATIFGVAGTWQSAAQSEQGVSFGGLTWATKNVGAEKTESFGNYYSWDEALKACPAGWRLPTKDELDYVLTNMTDMASNMSGGVKGWHFVQNPVSFSMPAAGYRNADTGAIIGQGQYGYYWSATETSQIFANYLYFDTSKINAYVYDENKSKGFTVRCVKRTGAVHTTGSSQGDAEPIPELVTLPFTRNADYLTIDYTALGSEQFGQRNGGAYMAVMPFKVEETIQAGELFWLALYAPEGSSFSQWGIYTKDFKFICKDWETYRDGNSTYILQSQDNLTEQIVPGEYHLMVEFTEMPRREDIWITLTYSTRQFYNDYAAQLAALKEDGSAGANESESQLVGTKWQCYYVGDFEEYIEILRFLSGKKVESEWSWWSYEWDDGYDGTQTGTYTIDGQKGVIKWDSGKQESFTIDGDKLVMDGDTFDKVE